MGRTRPIDWVNWRLYRRGWAACALAAVVVLATSFAPTPTPTAALQPTFTNESAAGLLHAAGGFRRQFPDRRPGSPGSLDAAQYVRNQLVRSGWTHATIATATTAAPGKAAPVPVVNVHATLPGRTREIIVVYAHRDNDPARGGTDDAVSTMALLWLAEDLAKTDDRRRTYLLASTDAANLNGAGARLLSQHLARGGRRVVAIVGLDRIGQQSRQLYVPITPSARFAPPLGLALAARDALREEGAAAAEPSMASQLLRLGAPITLFEHGQLVADGWPAVTLSAAGERATRRSQPAPAARVGDAMRALQRLQGTLDVVDTLQSAGKTWVVRDERVYRGWALKVLIASLLIPVWVAVVDMLIRMRREWALYSAVGSAARAMIGGLWALSCLWLLGGIGLIAGSSDVPPHPDAVGSAPVAALLLWALLSIAGWVLARAPDWRRVDVAGRDRGVLATALACGGVLAAVALAISPYSVLLAVPALHMWLWLCSRRVHGTSALACTWLLGLSGVTAACLGVGAWFDLGTGAPWYWLELVRARTVPAGLSMLAFAGAGLGALVLLAALGRVGSPALPTLRRLAQRAGVRARWRLHAHDTGAGRDVPSLVARRRTRWHDRV